MNTFVKKYNRLGEAKSPYLLQHKNNPVHWFLWGKEAFQAAREENKIIFLSIGYSTCYWCHMMEKDSFEIQEVADALNKDFISIKVDREEHPDVDQIYMDAVVGLTGRGGWPMSVFLTPDLKPFTGGTFFWRAQFLQILGQIQEGWKKNPQQIIEAGEKLVDLLKKRNGAQAAEKWDEDFLRKAFRQFQESFDVTYGGFGQAPKFPHSLNISLLLRMHGRTGNEDALKMATKTLDAMARGGMYDHLGGGFHRYSTDDQWLVPHFEKMLYDNALLATTYLEAFQVTQKEIYSEVARQILDYALRDMTHSDGGFYSAEDAGEVGKEGEFYVWKEEELAKALTAKELEPFKTLYGVRSGGNFEHGNSILHLPENQKWETKSDPLLQKVHQKLFQIREEREHPHKDDKILTSWNGLMITAMAKGYQVLGDKQYLHAAQKSANFVQERLWQKGALLRRYRDGDSRFEGTLEDYAFLIEGLLSLYEADFDKQWIDWALSLQKKQNEIFWDQKEGGYFMSDPKTTTLYLKKKEFHDGAIPSGNAVTALNLLRLYALTFDKGFQDRAMQLLGILAAEGENYPAGFAKAAIAMDYHLDRSKEIAVVGKPGDTIYEETKQYLFQTFLPNKVIAFGPPSELGDPSTLPILQGKQLLGGKTTIYVCENNLCQSPTNDFQNAKALIEQTNRYSL